MESVLTYRAPRQSSPCIVCSPFPQLSYLLSTVLTLARPLPLSSHGEAWPEWSPLGSGLGAPDPSQLSKPFFHLPWGQRSLIPSTQETHMDEDIFPEWTALWWNQVSGIHWIRGAMLQKSLSLRVPGLWESKIIQQKKEREGKGWEEEGTGFLG